MPDPRSPQGRIYPLPCLLAVTICALTAAGHDHLCAVGQWAVRAEQQDLARLGVPADPLTGVRPVPDESTIRRVLARVDPRVLSRALLGPWRGPNGAGRRRAASGGPSRRTRAYRAARAAKTPPDGQAAEAGTRAQARRGEGLAGVAVDGKSSRGARRRDGTRVHLIGVVEHGSGHLIDHLEVETKSNETTAFQPLLSGLDLHGVVVTFDALLSVRANLEWLVNVKGGHYLAVIKKNQPKLHDQLVNLPWAEVPVGDRTRDTGHGRQETRTLKVATLSGALALDFPGAVQAIRIQRWRKVKGKRPSLETVYAVTDLTAAQAGPTALARLARHYWHVEVKLHYVRDVSFGEDANTTRTGHAPANLATIRSAIINTIRAVGYPYVPEGRRDHTHPNDTIRLYGLG